MTGNQLDVIIDKKPIRALVDSGASFSVISDKYRRFLKKVLFADAKSVMLKVADGNFVRPIGKCVLRVRINNRELPFEFIVLSHCSHDVILGWDFLEASQAVIDCGQNELVLEDICRDSTAPDTWNLYATRDYTLKPHSLTRITVSGYQTRGDINVVLDGSKHLLFEKNIATPSMVSTYRNGKRECLAIVWVTNKFRPYIFGKHFTVVTDHHSLCWLMNLKDPSGRLARWALRLQEHDFDVKYKTGKKHSDADALSRNPVEEETETPDKFLAVTTSMNLALEQKKDQDLAKLKLLSNSSKNEVFRFIDGILCRKNFDPDGKLWLPVIPKHLRADILRHFHDAPTAGHLGFAKTYDRIRKRFYWPGMYRNVVRYVMHCRECQRRKSVPQRPPGRLVPIPPATAPFHRIGIDLLGRFPKSAHETNG
ncbi:retrovirus-related Pol polyprotein from transposon 17.6 [Trichonephila clavipes]|nr:retrovirus-related Pol polyprotein from transposon 17.6 [Trichonephila clavipes]